MFNWAAPIWLICLMVIPIIWWLHKTQRSGTEFLVSSLLFWNSGESDNQQSTPGTLTDPRWLIRALIASLIILSAAGPHWITNLKHHIHVWFDESLSMQTIEISKSRAVKASNILLKELELIESARVSLHSLSIASKLPLLLHKDNRKNWKTLIEQWIKTDSSPLVPPLSIQMDAYGEHWLVTDGANQNLLAWLKQAPVHRTLQVGQETENSAITLFSIRPSLKKSTAWDGLIEVIHHGLKPAHKTLELVVDSIVYKTWVLELLPGNSQQLSFKLDTNPEDVLLVRFIHNDSLHSDDNLKLSPTIKISTRIVGDCNPSVLSLIASHPTLDTDISSSEVVKLNIVCGDVVIPNDGNILKLHSSGQHFPLTASPVWSQQALPMNKLFLQKNWLRFYRPESKQFPAVPLLLVDSAAIITLNEYPRRTINCYLNMNWPNFTNRPEYPTLFSGLINMALNEQALDNINSSLRSSNESIISPLNIASSKEKPYQSPIKEIFDLTPYLIFVTIILLIIDNWLLKHRKIF